MNLPVPDDFIDIHNHGASPATGVFSVENLISSEERFPDKTAGLTYTIGIHPWHLTENNYQHQLEKVIKYSDHENIIALGEAGFDRIKGPDMKLQKLAFESQVMLSEKNKKPLYIHCVKAWEELLYIRKVMRLEMPWLVHGFRGKSELALQMISKGMYISFWFDFIIKPEASDLIRSLPVDRIFLETDGGNINIKDIYNKVSSDLNLTVQQLKQQIYSNFISFFGIK